MVNSLYIVVSLFNYDLDINLDFFSIFIISYIVDLKVLNISYKLSFDDINYYLPLIDNM